MMKKWFNGKAWVAGVCIGIGCVLYLRCLDNMVGALLFSIGLIMIRMTKLDLFTGKIQHLPTGKISVPDIAVVFLWNIIGIAMTALCFINDPAVTEGCAKIANARLNAEFFRLLPSAMLCGALMTIGTKAEAPLWVSSMCVFAFITCGGAHCVADGFYWTASGIPADRIPEAALRLLTVVGGNLIGGMIAALPVPLPKAEEKA